MRHDLSAMFLAHVDTVDRQALEGEFEKLESEGRERLEAEGVPEEQMSIQRLVDMRYLGQWRSLTIPVSAPTDLAEAVDRFHAEHERAYNYRRDGAPVEIYRLSLRAVGVTPKPQLKRHELNGGSAEAAREPRRSTSTRRALPSTRRSTSAPTWPAGTQLDGPAVVDQLDSTTVVPPGWRAEVDEWLNIRMHREEQE